MKNNKPDYKAMMTVIRLLHGSMALVMVFFGSIVLWLNMTNPIGTLNDRNEFLLYLPGLLLLVAIPSSSILFKNQVRQGLEKDLSLDRKLGIFQVAHLIRMAVFDAAGLMAAAISLVTGNNYNLAALVLVLLTFLFLFPSPSRITLDLNLSFQEKEILQKTI